MRQCCCSSGLWIAGQGPHRVFFRKLQQQFDYRSTLIASGATYCNKPWHPVKNSYGPSASQREKSRFSTLCWRPKFTFEYIVVLEHISFAKIKKWIICRTTPGPGTNGVQAAVGGTSSTSEERQRCRVAGSWICNSTDIRP